MALKITRPQGTEDITPENISKWYTVEQVARDTAKCFGFHEMRIPTFESTDLFLRSVGETTDVVQKEMYTVKAKETEFTPCVRRHFRNDSFHAPEWHAECSPAAKGILHSLLFPPRTAASRQTERIPPVRRGNGRQCRRCRRCGNHQSGKVDF